MSTQLNAQDLSGSFTGRLRNHPLRVRDIVPDLAAFLLGLGMARFLRWETRDLVWSLWLGSLVIGYLSIISAIVAMVYGGARSMREDKALGQKPRAALTLGGALLALFLFGFFSLHFCGFHAGHSVFLNAFFPLENGPGSMGFGAAFMNPVLLWRLAFRHLMAPYGLFLIPAIIAERHHLAKPIRRILDSSESLTEVLKPLISGDTSATATRKPGNPLENAMMRPYANVVRMHLLIFFFAFSHALKLDSFLIYAVIYAVYFFPWRIVSPFFKRQKGAATVKPPSHVGQGAGILTEGQ